MNYIEEAMRTRSGKYFTCNHDIEHGIIGLATESSELLEAITYVSGDIDYVNILEECGDLCWYLAILCFGYGWEFEDIDSYDYVTLNGDKEDIVTTTIDEIAIACGKLLDNLKKYHFYGKEFDDETNRGLAEDIYTAICYICQACGSDIESVKETNIKKLKARYPEKWTKETAINRDLENERDILEQQQTGN